MTSVKICGVRDGLHARVAVDAGAEMLGFIFYRSVRRFIEPTLARDIVRSLPVGSIQVVGVFVNEPIESMVEIADLVGLDWIQLSGDETPAEITRLPRPVLRTVHVSPTTTLNEALARAGDAAVAHLDAKRDGQYGGTGQTLDWDFARRVAENRSVLLAGGLDPGNVAEAIRAVQPWGVDVSSGVETDGAKDPGKIEAFVRAARTVKVLA